jgi:hypothetical protein
MAITKEELAAKIDVADWDMLRAHLERGGLIVVDQMLDLAEAGVLLANDDVKAIERWIVSGLLGKPTVPQVEQWDKERAKPFFCLIISPYVLIQEQPTANG